MNKKQINPTGVIGNGREIQRGEIDESDCPVTAATGHLIPEPIVAARAEMIRLAGVERVAMRALDDARRAVEPAGRADSEALGAAIAAGKPDPGAVHVPAARQAVLDAERQLAGTTEAKARSKEVFWAAMSIDHTDTVRALDALAAGQLSIVAAALDEIRSARSQYQSIRDLTVRLDAWPCGPVPVTRDQQTIDRAIGAISEEVHAMAEPRPRLLAEIPEVAEPEPEPEAA